VYAVQIQGEYVRVLVLETHRLLGSHGKSSEEEVGSSGQKVVVHREALLAALRLANNNIECRGEVITTNGQ